MSLLSLTHKLAQKVFPSAKPFSEAEKAGFLKAQRLAVRCAKDIRKELRSGVSEKTVASLMDQYLRDHGVQSFFHTSFAWFGDRTRFQGFSNYFDFLPSKRELRENDVVILDTAPILDSYSADIGYSFSVGKESEDFKQAHKLLCELYEELPKMFASPLTTREIWAKVDQEFASHGYDNAHSKYPFAVLGHRLHRHKLHRLPGIVFPFSWHSYAGLLKRGLLPDLLGPEHEGSKEGLWAIEPHLGATGFGVKFEEILVVERGQAYWLDRDGSGLLN